MKTTVRESKGVLKNVAVSPTWISRTRVHQPDPLRHPPRLRDVVGDDDKGSVSLTIVIRHDLFDHADIVGTELRSWLLEHQDHGFDDQRAGEQILKKSQERCFCSWGSVSSPI